MSSGAISKSHFASLGSLSFFEPDRQKFPALELAVGAIKRGGNAPCALNAANEAAVAAYLSGRIGFYDITDIVEKCLAGMDFVAQPSLDDIFATHAEVFARASEMTDKW